ncbi:hypothetical protein EUU23_09220 [Sphingorhabdus sp. IMCC26285]|uniref:Core-binding (CB) domain-containing protein n=1 Tax=Sphingorhabdus profundilacus TaxID=2509718 RepID=A0A6I4M5K2_9SPHN|nr:site-specific integrase [Sphingorhabdus profundilacus]MVZ97888.1 hypothetical protein [Sphingorhabdus profundilacus]
MCTHLTKRQSVYYFRRVIPVNLQSYFDNKKQWMHSLGTKDLAEGKRLARLAGTHTDGLIEQALHLAKGSGQAAGGASNSLAGRPVTPAEIEQTDYEERQRFEQEERYEGREDYRRTLEKRMALTTQELSPEEAAIKDLFAAKDYDHVVAMERLRIYRHDIRAASRQDDPDLLAQPAAIVPASLAAFAPGIMLDGDIIHRWAVERAVKLRGVEAHRAVARWFYERVGKKAVADITRADVLAFKNALVSEGQTLGNIKVKLSRLRTLLQWAADNDYAATNAAAGIKVIDRNAAKNKRTEFSLEALKAIFESPVYATGSRPTQGRGEAAYWLPLLALFTGARLEELGQLHLTDIMALTYSDLDGEDRTADFISIKEDDETGQSVKNEHSIRKVPVHPELKRLGFLAYCDEMRRQGHLRLFPELKPNKFGTLTSKWGEWFGKYKREICGVTDSRMTFHSFRHTFKQYARQVGVVEGIQTQIMGHSGDSVADDYGSGFYMHPVVEGMAMYKIPGLKLPKAWR